MAAGTGFPAEATALRRFARPLSFAAIGALNTALDVALFAALVDRGLPPATANLVSYSSGIGSSYLLNGRITFQLGWRELASARRAATFAAINLVGLAIGTAVVALLAGAIGAVPAKLASLAATFIWNFSMSSRLVTA